jgi:hypothetical protein
VIDSNRRARQRGSGLTLSSTKRDNHRLPLTWARFLILLSPHCFLMRRIPALGCRLSERNIRGAIKKEFLKRLGPGLITGTSDDDIVKAPHIPVRGFI